VPTEREDLFHSSGRAARVGPVRVAVLDDYQRVALRYGPWEDLGETVQVAAFCDHLYDDDAVAEQLEPFEIVVTMRERTPFPRTRLERLPRLRLLVTTGMANAAIDLDAARELGITVAGTGGLVTPAVELTWGLILAVTRNIATEDQRIRSGGWQKSIGPGLAGRTLGLVGLGRIGRRVAAIAQAFEMKVIAWSPNLQADTASALGIEAVHKDALFERADVVTVHIVLSDRTRGLIGASHLARMKPSAYLVNTSRGPIVDERALLDALRGGRIAGAALDVFDTEPLPLEHALRTTPNTVLTPHIGFVSIENYEIFFRDVVENIAAFLDGTPLRILNG
jgi:phosphoglycerate dehydrogenase-like enzyme